MIKTATRLRESQTAFDLWYRMYREKVVPTKDTFTAIFEACQTRKKAKVLYWEFLSSGIKMDFALASAFIEMLARCGRVVEAEKVFQEQQTTMDVGIWNTMLSVYGHTNIEKAAAMLENMQKSNILPNEKTFTALLAACNSAGKSSKVVEFYWKMHEYGVTPTLQHQKIVVDALGKDGKLDEAEFFIETEVDTKADVVIWTTLLLACQAHSDIKKAQRATEKVLQIDPQNQTACALLANTYAGRGQKKKG